MADYVVHPVGLREEAASDYRDHARTYYSFVHLLRWIVAHFALVLVSLYFLAVANQPLLGSLLLGLAILVGGFGIVSTSSAAHRQVGEPSRGLLPRRAAQHG